MMSEFSINDVGVKVGLEIHQQLATNKKLFCDYIHKTLKGNEVIAKHVYEFLKENSKFIH